MDTRETTYKKMFIDMIAVHLKDGSTRPLKFKLEDDTVVVIDRVKFCQRAASTKVGGGGLRYTVMIRGVERFIFEDEGKWFIEAREE